MAGAAHYRHRDGLLPGAVVSACAYESSGMPEGDHRGLPSPWITFIVSVDKPVRVSGTVDEGDRFDPDRATSYDVVVAGLHPVAARVEQPAEQRGVQLALHPLAAPALLGCRSAELVGPGDHGHEVLGRAAAALHDRVSSRTDSQGRLGVVQEWVRSRVDDDRRTSVRPELVGAWQFVQATGGSCRVEDLARAVALSPRQLRTLMVAETGLSPKQLCRQFRFDTVIAHLADGSRSLAEIAAVVGYADQAHLTREFRRMAGCTPSQWLAEERRNIQDGGHRNRPDWGPAHSLGSWFTMGGWAARQADQPCGVRRSRESCSCCSPAAVARTTRRRRSPPTARNPAQDRAPPRPRARTMRPPRARARARVRAQVRAPPPCRPSTTGCRWPH